MKTINFSKITAIAIIALTALAIASVCVFRANQKREAHIDIPRDRYPVIGIDVSSHNGDIDFNRVAHDSIDFVFIKATEGISYRDPKFEENYQAARDAGLAVGAYHFFRFDCEGWRQSENVLLATAGKDLDMPIAIDVEEWGNPSDETTEVILRRLNDMIDHLAINGRHVIVYTNRRGYSRFIRNNFSGLQVWICSFTIPPLAREDWTLWQHSHKRHVDGIDGFVDLNTFNGDRKDWIQWLKAPYQHTIKHNKYRYNS